MNLIGGIILLGSFLSGVLTVCKSRASWLGWGLLFVVLAFTITRLAVEKGWEWKFETLPNGIFYKEVHDTIWCETYEFENGKCPLGYSLHDHDSRVKKEIWCVEFFSPGQYAFGFDASSKLITRYHYQSP